MSNIHCVFPRVLTAGIHYTKSPVSCLSVLPHQFLEHRRVSTDHLVNILAVLEDDKGGHGADAERSRQIRQLINVKLDKLDALKVRLIREPAGALGMISNALRLDTYLERMGEMALQGPHQVAWAWIAT